MGPQLAPNLIYTLSEEWYLALDLPSHSGQRISGVHADAQSRIGSHAEDIEIVEALPRPVLVSPVTDVNWYELALGLRTNICSLELCSKLRLAVNRDEPFVVGYLNDTSPRVVDLASQFGL